MNYLDKNDEPWFISALSPQDKEGYMQLRKNFCTNYNQDNIVSSFNNVLVVIKDYSIRSNQDDTKRCDACGVCWLPDKLAVNANRLSYLTGQNKNCINSALTKMSYIPDKFTSELFDFLPNLQGNTKEMRMWTIRKFSASTPSARLRIERSVVIFGTPKSSFTMVRTTSTWSYEDYAMNDTDNPGDFFTDPLVFYSHII